MHILPICRGERTAWKIIIDQPSDKVMLGRAFSIARNRAWAKENRQELIAKFGEGTYLAVSRESVIDSDRDMGALAKRLRRDYPEEMKSMAIEFLGEEKTSESQPAKEFKPEQHR